LRNDSLEANKKSLGQKHSFDEQEMFNDLYGTLGEEEGPRYL